MNVLNLQTGKPVFALVCKGALSRMVETTGAGVWADADSVAAIADRLAATLRMPPRSADQLERINQQFNYRFLTARLSDYIRRVTEERRIPG